MQDRSSSKIVLILSAVFAVLSIPSAYLFGLSAPLRVGLNSLLDSTFFGQELFRFTLLLVGVSAFARPGLGFLVHIFSPSYGDPDEEPKTLLGRYGRRATLVITLLLFSFFVLNQFLEAALIFSFAMFIVLYVIISFVLYERMTEKSDKQDGLKFSKYLFVSIQPKLYVNDPPLMSVNLGLALVVAATFGYLRTVSMSLSHPYCVTLQGHRIEAAILGKTDFGLVIADVKSADWTPFTIPVGLSWINPKVYSIINLDEVVSITWSCE